MTTLVEVVIGLVLSILSIAVDVHLFEVEVGWEGLAGWDIRPVNAVVLWVAVVCPPA